MFGRIASLVALALVVSATGTIHARIPPTTQAERGEPFVPDPQIARVMAVGFDAVLSDYYWLQAVQLIGGDTRITAEIGEQIGRLIDVVTSLDPWVDHPYRFAAIWLTESEENVRKANELLERGIAHHPNEWRNHFYKGFNHFFYLMENEEAAIELERASQLPGSAAYLPRLVARLRADTADIDVAEVLLLDMMSGTDDEAAKAFYQGALDEIEIEKKARFLDRARAAFQQLHGRDIMIIDELVDGPKAVLSDLPNPEPDSLPDALSRGSEWKLDFESDRIVSTYFGRRYELHFASWERARAEKWARERAAREAGEAAGEDGTGSGRGMDDGG